MLFFRSEELLNEWLASNKVERGAVLSVPHIWELSQRWYRNRLSADYHGRNMDQIQALFREVGLNTEFWQAG